MKFPGGIPLLIVGLVLVAILVWATWPIFFMVMDFLGMGGI